MPADRAARLVTGSRLFHRLVDGIVAAHGVLDVPRAVDAVYRDDPDGGPLDPANTLSATLTHLTRKGVLQAFEAHGWRLVRPGWVGRDGGAYRIEAVI